MCGGHNHSLEATGDAALIWNQACMIGVVQLPVMGRTPAPQLEAVMLPLNQTYIVDSDRECEQMRWRCMNEKFIG